MTEFAIEEPKQRPTFLTVLCILSWITAGWTSTQALLNLLTKESSIESLESSKEVIESTGMEMEGEGITFLSNLIGGSLEAVQNQIDNFMLINTTNLILYVTQILAVFFMYKLLKKGFWIYTSVQIILLLIPFVYMTVNSVMILGTLFSAFITLAFVIMYATNLKHMN